MDISRPTRARVIFFFRSVTAECVRTSLQVKQNIQHLNTKVWGASAKDQALLSQGSDEKLLVLCYYDSSARTHSARGMLGGNVKYSGKTEQIQLQQLRLIILHIFSSRVCACARSKDWRCCGRRSHAGEITMAGSRRLRSTLAAVPVLCAHAVVTEVKINKIITPIRIEKVREDHTYFHVERVN